MHLTRLYLCHQRPQRIAIRRIHILAQLELAGGTIHQADAEIQATFVHGVEAAKPLEVILAGPKRRASVVGLVLIVLHFSQKRNEIVV